MAPCVSIHLRETHCKESRALLGTSGASGITHDISACSVVKVLDRHSFNVFRLRSSLGIRRTDEFNINRLRQFLF